MLFWPSGVSPFSVIGPVPLFAFVGLIAWGGLLELRRVAVFRSKSLTLERARREQLTDLVELKSDFTAMAAHELGGHTAAVGALVAMLRSQDLRPEEKDKALLAIEAETELLGTLVHDVGAGAAAERDDFHLQVGRTSIDSIVLRALWFAQTLPDDHPLIAPQGSLKVFVWADPMRIDQVMSNLLTNAAKYSPAGTPIELKVALGEKSVRIDVIDRGFGIPPGDMERILKRFGRGGNEPARKEGLGLGLYLSQRILHAHGSDLKVASEAGKGSTFGFELTIAE